MTLAHGFTCSFTPGYSSMAISVDKFVRKETAKSTESNIMMFKCLPISFKH